MRRLRRCDLAEGKISLEMCFESLKTQWHFMFILSDSRCWGLSSVIQLHACTVLPLFLWGVGEALSDWSTELMPIADMNMVAISRTPVPNHQSMAKPCQFEAREEWKTVPPECKCEWVPCAQTSRCSFLLPDTCSLRLLACRDLLPRLAGGGCPSP